MPELPEVEMLVRHLSPQLCGRRIRDVAIHDPRIVRPDRPDALIAALRGATINRVSRRGKFLLFELHRGPTGLPLTLLGHLGMTGRMFLQTNAKTLPPHARVHLDLGDGAWIFDDPRLLGRLTLDRSVLQGL